MDYGLHDLRQSVDHADVSVASVSHWSVGMQIHHCCLATAAICQSLIDSKPPPPRRRWSPITSIVFLSGRIPRGRGKAPEVALPKQDISTDELVPLLDRSEQLLEQVSQLDRSRWFKHFAFGILDRDKSLKLLRIHNRHHLRIVADIVAAKQKTEA
jgi:hypothetical protein